ncbi:hypothetical protein PENTCL1PPCAC_4052, partial [Pristionchus entomophagus]
SLIFVGPLFNVHQRHLNSISILGTLEGDVNALGSTEGNPKTLPLKETWRPLCSSCSSHWCQNAAGWSRKLRFGYQVRVTHFIFASSSFRNPTLVRLQDMERILMFVHWRVRSRMAAPIANDRWRIMKFMILQSRRFGVSLSSLVSQLSEFACSS